MVKSGNYHFENKTFIISVTQAKVMDMVPNAVDDQYTHCREQMLKKVVEGGLLEEELKNRKTYSDAWGAKQCTKLIPGGVKQHTNALVAYGHGGYEFRNMFNQAVETQGGNVTVYNSNFQFKSLHFLLMDAMRLLKTENCQTVFRGSSKDYEAQVGSEVRFGRFTSTKAKRSDAEESALDNGILFNITSCTVVNVDDYTCFSDSIDQLISPAEVFRVAEVKNVRNEDDEYREIVLTSSRTHTKRYVNIRLPNRCRQHKSQVFLKCLPYSLENERLSLSVCLTRSPTTTSPPSITPKGSSTQWLGSSLSVLVVVVVSLSISLITRTDHL
uniref:NAD(P)(+)--arginine ADP-ribosyltransferase n=1 Tax=Oncorhynchus kisutch TaxID=8019 RepID=A0A8C7MIH6_ONCKI